MKEIKENIINDLVERLNSSPFMIVIDYKELTVSQFEEMRTRLTDSGPLHTLPRIHTRKGLLELLTFRKNLINFYQDKLRWSQVKRMYVQLQKY